MNKAIKTILIISIAVFGAGFLFVPSTFAQDNLVVQFENDPDPLFNEINFVPGESITRWVDVGNDSGQTKKIGVEIVDKSSCTTDCLTDVLTLTIKKDGATLLSGTLTNFYGAGEQVLSDLNTGDTTRYYFSMTFDYGAGNIYQNSTTKFDIKIGFFGEESIGQEIPSGGGGAVIIAGLQISNETVSEVTNNSVIITWLTTGESTSRVIYSPEGFPHLLQVNNPPNYGYVFSTIEDSAKVTSHTVVITGLLPGTTYYYRCVSHTSPDETITTEHTFTTLTLTEGEGEEGIGEEEEEEEREKIEEGIEEEISEEKISEEGLEPEVKGEEVAAEEEGEGEIEEGIVVEEEKEEEGREGTFLAAIGQFFSGLSLKNLLWILLIIAIVLLIAFISSRRRKKKIFEKKT